MRNNCGNFTEQRGKDVWSQKFPIHLKLLKSSLKVFIAIINMYIFVYVCLCACLQRSKGYWTEVMSCLMWVLNVKLGSSLKTNMCLILEDLCYELILNSHYLLHCYKYTSLIFHLLYENRHIYSCAN